jgi:hypothetical protein
MRSRDIENALSNSNWRPSSGRRYLANAALSEFNWKVGTRASHNPPGVFAEQGFTLRHVPAISPPRSWRAPSWAQPLSRFLVLWVSSEPLLDRPTFLWERRKGESG